MNDEYDLISSYWRVGTSVAMLWM